jgi:flagellar basal body-associated protein FliL
MAKDAGKDKAKDAKGAKEEKDAKGAETPVVAKPPLSPQAKKIRLLIIIFCSLLVILIVAGAGIGWYLAKQAKIKKAEPFMQNLQSTVKTQDVVKAAEKIRAEEESKKQAAEKEKEKKQATEHAKNGDKENANKTEDGKGEDNKNAEGTGDVSLQQFDMANIKGPLHYETIQPALIIKLDDPVNQTILQLELTAVIDNEQLSPILKTHTPRIKNDVISLLAQKKRDELLDPKVRMDLKAAVLQTINQVLQENKVEGEVKGVLFTTYMVQ